MKSILAKFLGKYLESKAELYDGTPDSGKAWYKSKTILAGIAIFLRGIYEGASQLAVTSGKSPLPPIPPVVDSLLISLLGATAIHGRINANMPIVVDEDKPPKQQITEKV